MYVDICRRLFDVVQSALKSHKKSKHPPVKPAVLPIISMEQMEAFEHIEEDIYLSVVSITPNIMHAI